MRGDELLKLSHEDLALHAIEGWNLASSMTDKWQAALLQLSEKESQRQGAHKAWMDLNAEEQETRNQYTALKHSAGTRITELETQLEELREAALAMVKHMKDRHELSTCCHDVTPTPAYVLERAISCLEQTHPSGEPCMERLPCKWHKEQPALKRKCECVKRVVVEGICADCGRACE